MPDLGPRIHITISSHGYGHLTQSIALMRELMVQVPDISFRIQCHLPEQLISERLGCDDFEYEFNSMDIGLIQSDPITPDLKATYQAYSSFHHNFNELVAYESMNLKKWHPDLVISDIPYLPIAAAGRVGIPSVALASLTWDSIIQSYFDLSEKEPARWYAQAQAAYGEAQLALLPTPAMNGDCFVNKQYIPPIAIMGRKQPLLRSALNIKDNDNRPLILCSLGGIAGAKLPLSIMTNEMGFHWLISGSYSSKFENIHSLESCGWCYKDILASVDGVIGKPGYGMAVEVCAHGLPFVFFRRGHFPDEPVIIDWLQKNTRAKEISNHDWSTGKFVEPLKELPDLTAPDPPLCNGAEVGAQAVIDFLKLS